MTTIISRTAALNLARAAVSDLRYAGPGASYDSYGYSVYDKGCDAWVESRPTWYAAAILSRRVALAKAAVEEMLNAMLLADPDAVPHGDEAERVQQHVYDGLTAAAAVDIVRARLATA